MNYDLHFSSLFFQVTLFSAVVTAFLVPALGALSQNPVERTNELVSNLTEIVIQLSRVEPSSLDFSVSSAFKPNPDIVRQNVLWSLSLVTSVSRVVSSY